MPWNTTVDGKMCDINDIVKIEFATEEQAQNFSKYIVAAGEDSEKTKAPQAADSEAPASKRSKLEDDAALDLDGLIEAMPCEA